jgi:putative transposase
MPRKTRNYQSGLPVHVVQRGNNRLPTFYDSNDYRQYLNYFEEGLRRYGAVLHAYCLMPNHVHLLITPSCKEGISRTMQHLGRRYVLWFNKKHGRTGTLWEGRHKGKVITNDNYLLACYRYIEMNPVKADMVRHPKDYLWSSYRANAFGEDNPLITSHAIYDELAVNERRRHSNYRSLFEKLTDEGEEHFTFVDQPPQVVAI